jgi:MFS family permease
MKRMRWYDYITINLFWLGLNIRNNAVGSIFMPYRVVAFVPESIQNSALGVMSAAGLMIAMLVQPAVGLLSDRSTSRYGRRRPFIFVGVLLDLVFLALIAAAQNYWAMLVAVLLIQISSNISHGALQGLIPDLVPEDQRGIASAVKSIFELLPLVLLGFTIAQLVTTGQFTWAVFATGAALLVVMLVTVFFVKEEPLLEKPDTPLGPPMVRVLGLLLGIVIGALAGLAAGLVVGGLAALIAWPLIGGQAALAVLVGVGGVVCMVTAVVAGVWSGAALTLGRRDAASHAPFTWWVTNRLMFLAAVTSIQRFAILFLIYAFKVSAEESAGMAGKLFSVVGIFTLISAVSAGWLSRRVGPRNLTGFSGLLAAAGTALLVATIFAPNGLLIYVIGCILGVAVGIFNTANWELGTDLVPPEEAGRYLGISNLAGAGAGMVGAGIGGLMIDYLNRYQTGLGYFVVFGGYALLFTLSIATLRGISAKKAFSPAAGEVTEL